MDNKINQKEKGLHLKLKTADNSSMTQNLDEVKRLGKEMDNVKTGPELKEEECLTPDPKQ
jgi:hypothetical protein